MKCRVLIENTTLHNNKNMQNTYAPQGFYPGSDKSINNDHTLVESIRTGLQTLIPSTFENPEISKDLQNLFDAAVMVLAERNSATILLESMINATIERYSPPAHGAHSDDKPGIPTKAPAPPVIGTSSQQRINHLHQHHF